MINISKGDIGTLLSPSWAIGSERLRQMDVWKEEPDNAPLQLPGCRPSLLKPLREYLRHTRRMDVWRGERDNFLFQAL